MKQRIQMIGAPDFGQDRYLPKQSFAVLFALARKPQTNAELSASIGISPSVCRRLLEGLQRGYLVDMVSQLDGNDVRQTLQLTDEGEVALLRAMERVYELPE